MSDAEDDDPFAIAHATWRQFHGLHLELPAPTQPEVDGRLWRYRRGHETDALRDFAAGTLMLTGIGKALADLSGAFNAGMGVAESLVFALTCVLAIAVGSRSLTHLRHAIEHHAMAQRIGVEGIDWQRAEAMLADVRDLDVRAYCQSVRGQGRTLRRAEAALALERGRGTPPATEIGADAFSTFVREGREGPSRREFAIVAICLVAVAAARTPGFDPMALLPGLLLLGIWSFTDLLGPLLQLLLDPWQLRGGGPACRRLRYALIADLAPHAAVLLAVIATAVGLASTFR
ncbi:MAG: hypothetical protein WD382_03240 [Halofilum sp. (in: g-proteobacteria)]